MCIRSLIRPKGPTVPQKNAWAVGPGNVRAATLSPGRCPGLGERGPFGARFVSRRKEQNVPPRCDAKPPGFHLARPDAGSWELGDGGALAPPLRGGSDAVAAGWGAAGRGTPGNPPSHVQAGPRPIAPSRAVASGGRHLLGPFALVPFRPSTAGRLAATLASIQPMATSRLTTIRQRRRVHPERQGAGVGVEGREFSEVQA